MLLRLSKLCLHTFAIIIQTFQFQDEVGDVVLRVCQVFAYLWCMYIALKIIGTLVAMHAAFMSAHHESTLVK